VWEQLLIALPKLQVLLLTVDRFDSIAAYITRLACACAAKQRHLELQVCGPSEQQTHTACPPGHCLMPLQVAQPGYTAAHAAAANDTTWLRVVKADY
jgi:hypothetical protein